MIMSIASEKSQLRSEIKLKIGDIKDRDKRSGELLDEVVQSGVLSEIKFVSVFISMADEIDMSPVIDYFWENSV